MTSLSPPKLGTDPIRGWAYYSVHLTGSYVLKEYFLAFNYCECLAAAETRKSEVGPWAVTMRCEGYHELFTHSFIGMWAAFEAGIEDTTAAFIKNSIQAATTASSRFRVNRYRISEWPWSDDICSEIAQKLDQKAKEATKDGGFDLYERYRTMFSWLEINMDENPELSLSLAEASLMRNIIVHRYGRIDEGDVKLLPKLAKWQGGVMPIDRATFSQYYNAIKDVILALMSSISKSPHVKNQGT
jgi:hypothetical protein